MVVCVECAAPVSCIYRRFPSSSQENIRLQRCDACGAIADKYVEYETLLLFVELLLHKPQTYRHILFNRLPYADAGLPRPLYRLALACILFDAYTIWFLLHVDHARFYVPSIAEQHSGEEEEEEGHARQQQLQHYQQRQPPSQQVRQLQQQGRERRLAQEQHATLQPHTYQKDSLGQSRSAYMQKAGHLQQGIFPDSGVSVAGVCSGVEPVPGVDPAASFPSPCCYLTPSPGGSPAAAVATRRVDGSSVDSAATALAVHCTLAALPDAPAASAGLTAFASAAAAAAADGSGMSLPSALAAVLPAPPCDAVLQQAEQTLVGKQVSPAASGSGRLRLAELEGGAAAAAASGCPHHATPAPPFPARRRPPLAAAAAPPPQSPHVSPTRVSNAERHADMLRWLLHNPVMSVDQQLLIFSVSFVDFVVYIFATIFFADLFLRLSFRRRCAQQRRQQHRRQPRESTSSVCTLQTPAAALRVVPPLCSRLGMADGAGETESHWREKALERRQSPRVQETRRETGADEAEMTRPERRVEEQRVETEEELGLAAARMPQGVGKADDKGDRAQQQNAEELTETGLREGSVSNGAGGVDKGAGLYPAERGERRERETELAQEEKQDTARFVPHAARKAEARQAWVAKSRWGTGHASESPGSIVWTQGFSVLSSWLNAAWHSFAVARREVLGLVFDCENQQEQAATAAESRGVVLVKYNYLAAAVTLSMFGKLGTLILMAWEESLGPRCFMSLFTFTSNVLAVDVFLNSQHPAPAVAIVVAAAAVRAFARLAQQVAFPSVAFPPCALLVLAEPGGVEHLVPLLNLLALFL